MQSRLGDSSVIAMALFVYMAAAPTKAQNVVLVENFDTNVDDWTFSPTPLVEMSWDGLEGSPLPGSLRISFLEPPPDFIAHLAFSRCMEANPGEVWGAEAKVRKTGTLTGQCVVFITQYRGPGCTGQRTTVGNVPFIKPNFWLPTDWLTRIGSASHSVRIALGLNVFPGTGESHCHFDSIVVTNDRLPAVTDVPGLSSAGLGVLAVVTGLIGCFFLRRTHKSKTR